MGTREYVVKVQIEVPDSLVGRVRDVVKAGEYGDAEEFVVTALKNQLEQDEGEIEVKTLEEAIEQVDSSEPQRDSSDVTDATSQTEINSERSGYYEDPPVASIVRKEYGNIQTVDKPEASRLDDGPLWGQYNRLFPIKLVVRCLANELVDSPDDVGASGRWVPLGRFENNVAHVARSVGTEIARHDEQAGRKRGEKLATGLPVGDDAERSIDRFKTHFVGRVERDRDLTGAPPQLRFVDIRRDDRPKIGLTNVGRDFAALSNPLLDDGLDAKDSLGDEERRFYLEHVREAYRPEYQAMQTVAKAISEGDNRPTSLTERVAYLDPSWSKSQAKTIRSGLTSRMYELHLVTRQRVGQRGIAYELTDRGSSFLKDETAFDADSQ